MSQIRFLSLMISLVLSAFIFASNKPEVNSFSVASSIEMKPLNSSKLQGASKQKKMFERGDDPYIPPKPSSDFRFFEFKKFMVMRTSSHENSCAFYSLGLSRSEASDLLLDNIHDPIVRRYIGEQIFAALLKAEPQQLPEDQSEFSSHKAILEKLYKFETNIDDFFRELNNSPCFSDNEKPFSREEIISLSENKFSTNLKIQDLIEKIKKTERELAQIKMALMHECQKEETVMFFLRNFIAKPGKAMEFQFDDEAGINHSVLDAISYLKKSSLRIYRSVVGSNKLTLRHKFDFEQTEEGQAEPKKICYILHEGDVKNLIGHFSQILPVDYELRQKKLECKGSPREYKDYQEVIEDFVAYGRLRLGLIKEGNQLKRRMLMYEGRTLKRLFSTSENNRMAIDFFKKEKKEDFLEDTKDRRRLIKDSQNFARLFFSFEPNIPEKLLALNNGSVIPGHFYEIDFEVETIDLALGWNNRFNHLSLMSDPVYGDKTVWSVAKISSKVYKLTQKDGRGKPLFYLPEENRSCWVYSRIGRNLRFSKFSISNLVPKDYRFEIEIESVNYKEEPFLIPKPKNGTPQILQTYCYKNPSSATFTQEFNFENRQVEERTWTFTESESRELLSEGSVGVTVEVSLLNSLLTVGTQATGRWSKSSGNNKEKGFSMTYEKEIRNGTTQSITSHPRTKIKGVFRSYTSFKEVPFSIDLKIKAYASKLNDKGEIEENILIQDPEVIRSLLRTRNITENCVSHDGYIRYTMEGTFRLDVTSHNELEIRDVDSDSESD